jgi:1,2-diacylglycerol 3-beta-glucosyltransferase
MKGTIYLIADGGATFLLDAAPSFLYVHSVMVLLLTAFAFCYTGLVLACAAALARGRRDDHPAFRPAVSVVIAARNEEAALPRCLDAIARLTYPPALLEVIVVDDGSTDRTGEILHAAAGRLPYLRPVRAEQGGPLRGKVNALATGIEAASGEILLFTDADCRVPPGWVEETVRFYTGERVGLVAGFTLLGGTSLFARLQALDWLFLFSLASAALRLRFPITAVGNNLSVRRTAYDSVGGYRRIPFSVTEDFALFTAVTAAGWTARFPLHAPACVESTPCADLRQLYEQKKRWFLGGVGMTGMRRVFFGVAWMFFVLIVAAAWSGDWIAAGTAFAVKSAADMLLVLPTLRALGRRALLALLPIYEPFALAVTILFPPLVLLHPSVRWKDRTVQNEHAPR